MNADNEGGAEMVCAPLPTLTSIRLLEILKRSEDGLFSCSLESFDLDNRPIYNCLSYAWVNPDPVSNAASPTPINYNTKWPIMINDQLFLVQQNLYDAMNMLWEQQSMIVEQPDQLDQTRLCWAMANLEDIDLVRHLVHNGADIVAQSKHGHNPLDYGIGGSEKRATYARVLLQAELDKIQNLGYDKPDIQLRYEAILKSLVKPHPLKAEAEASEAMRRPGTSQNLIWIDAICINQEDIEERSAQVNLMGRIFRSAETVVAWLGPDVPYSQLAIECIQELSADPNGKKWQYFVRDQKEAMRSPDVALDHGLEVLEARDIPMQKWTALSRFFQLRWFERSWIAQEAILAKSILMILGCHRLHWGDLYRASSMLGQTNWRKIVKDMFTPSEIKTVIYAATRGLEYGRLRHTIVGNPEYQESSVSRADFRRVMIGGRTRFATDPRDKIYSLLGFALPPKAESFTIRADYNKTVSEVYTAAAKAVMMDSEELLELSLVEDRIARVTPDLPSWVPDYTLSSGRDPLVCNGRKHGWLEGGSYQASGERSLYLDFPSDEPQHCILSGRPIGKVCDIVDLHYHPDLQPGETGELIQWLDLTLRIPETYQFTDECCGKALWRTLIADHVNGETPAPEASYNAFRRWLWWQLAEAA